MKHHHQTCRRALPRPAERVLQTGRPDADPETVNTKPPKRRLPAALLGLSLPLLVVGVGCGSTTPTATPPATPADDRAQEDEDLRR